MKKNKYLAFAIVSLVIVLGLNYFSDYQSLLGDAQEYGEQADIDLGENKNCSPVEAICSIAIFKQGKGERIKFALHFANQPGNKQATPIDLTVYGIDKNTIRKVELVFISLEAKQSESEFAPITARLNYLADKSQSLEKVTKNTKSAWEGQITLDNQQPIAKPWQAMIRINTLESSYSATFNFAVSANTRKS